AAGLRGQVPGPACRVRRRRQAGQGANQRHRGGAPGTGQYAAAGIVERRAAARVAVRAGRQRARPGSVSGSCAGLVGPFRSGRRRSLALAGSRQSGIRRRKPGRSGGRSPCCSTRVAAGSWPVRHPQIWRHRAGDPRQSVQHTALLARRPVRTRKHHMSLIILRISVMLGLALAAGGCLPANAASQTINLAERAQRFVPVAGVPQRVAVADPAVADIQVLPAEGGGAGGVLLTGMHAGDTELRIWGQSGALQSWQIHVVGAAQAALARAGAAPDAQVAQAGDTAVIAGRSESLLTHRAAQVAAGDKAADLSTVNTTSMVQVYVQVVELSRSVMM